MTDDSFLKWSMSERPRRLKRWAHFVRCEIPLHKDEQECLGDGTDLASELEEAAEGLEEAAEALTKLTKERDALTTNYYAAAAQVGRYREALERIVVLDTDTKPRFYKDDSERSGPCCLIARAALEDE